MSTAGWIIGGVAVVAGIAILDNYYGSAHVKRHVVTYRTNKRISGRKKRRN